MRLGSARRVITTFRGPAPIKPETLSPRNHKREPNTGPANRDIYLLQGVRAIDAKEQVTASGNTMAEGPDPKTFGSWEDAFQYPVAAVRGMEKQLRSDIDSNRERLRSLVGYAQHLCNLQWDSVSHSKRG